MRNPSGSSACAARTAAPVAMPAAIAAAAALALAPTTLAAQAGASAATVLELPSSARAMALGDAYAAMAGDDAVLFYNPAGLATLAATSASFSVQRHVAASTLAAGSLALQLGPGTLGFGVQALDYGSEPEVVPDPEFGGERGMETGAQVGAQDVVLSLGYATSFGVGDTGSGTGIGVAANYVRKQVAGESGGAAAVDVGVTQRITERVSLGAAIQNLGGDLTLAGASAPLPRTLRFGAALQLPAVGALALQATAEGVKPREGSVLPAAGLEATWRARNGVQVAGRVGGAGKPEDAAGSSLSFGAGVAARTLSLDYAYRGYDTVGGGVHRVGVRWHR